jgi:GNAT superfamily N-acetyltransferase
VTGGFVRAARASDAVGLAGLQVASWQATLAGIVPDEVIAELGSEVAVVQWADRWLDAITKPPTSRHRVHVAVTEPSPAGGGELAGFAAAGPAIDEDLWPGTDGELFELHVLPRMTGQGHGRRLLHAVADIMAEDGFRTAITWALEADSSRISFLEDAGWAPDGSRSNLDMGTTVPVVRLHTLLTPPRDDRVSLPPENDQ